MKVVPAASLEVARLCQKRTNGLFESADPTDVVAKLSKAEALAQSLECPLVFLLLPFIEVDPWCSSSGPATQGPANRFRVPAEPVYRERDS